MMRTKSNSLSLRFWCIFCGVALLLLQSACRSRSINASQVEFPMHYNCLVNIADDYFLVYIEENGQERASTLLVWALIGDSQVDGTYLGKISILGRGTKITVDLKASEKGKQSLSFLAEQLDDLKLPIVSRIIGLRPKEVQFKGVSYLTYQLDNTVSVCFQQRSMMLVGIEYKAMAVVLGTEHKGKVDWKKVDKQRETLDLIVTKGTQRDK